MLKKLAIQVIPFVHCPLYGDNLLYCTCSYNNSCDNDYYLFRPLKLTTPEFGKKWGSSSNEKKLKMATTNIQKPSDFMELMSNQFNFHPIEIISKL